MSTLAIPMLSTHIHVILAISFSAYHLVWLEYGLNTLNSEHPLIIEHSLLWYNGLVAAGRTWVMHFALLCVFKKLLGCYFAYVDNTRFRIKRSTTKHAGAAAHWSRFKFTIVLFVCTKKLSTFYVDIN